MQHGGRLKSEERIGKSEGRRVRSDVRSGSRYGKGNVAEHANEAEITKNLFVVPNDGVGDHRPDHGNNEQAAGIKEKAGGEIRKDKGE